MGKRAPPLFADAAGQRKPKKTLDMCMFRPLKAESSRRAEEPVVVKEEIVEQ